MNAEQFELYRRITTFEIDEPGVRLSFTARLARENGWDLDYSRRVVVEYKRFILLALAAGHPVTPSEQVDQAWHLHLVYTRSYWDDFCGKLLGRPLHHGPTKGGRDEQAKHRGWYVRTKESYRRLFGEEPPADLWPDAETRFGADLQFRRVSTTRNWVVPIRPLRWLVAIAALLFACLLAVAGCASTDAANRASAPPANAEARIAKLLNLPGPQFLFFFAISFAVAVIMAATIRWLARWSAAEREWEALHLDPYEVAYLSGGEEAAVNAALASLVSRGALKVDSQIRLLFRQDDGMPDLLHPFESAVFKVVDPTLGKSIDELQHDSQPRVDVAARLRSRGLIVSDERALIGRALSFLVAIAVPLLGVIKIFIGILRDKPIVYLVIGCIIAAGIAFGAFGQRLLRTWKGERVLKRIKGEYAALGANVGANCGELIGLDLVLALALFGIGVLEAGPLADLHVALKPPSGSGGGGGGGADGGCGGGCGGCG